MKYLFEFNKKDIESKTNNEKELKANKKAMLYKALDNRNTFKIKIENATKIAGKGVAIKGTVDYGLINKGDVVNINGKMCKIENIEKYGKSIDVAGYPWTRSMDTITLTISGIENEVIYTGLQVIDILKSSAKNSEENNVLSSAQNYNPNSISSNEPFSMEISDVFSITGRGIVLAGRILNGKISVGDSVTVDSKQGVVTGIEKFRRLLDKATVSDGEIGLMIGGLKKCDASVSSVVKRINNSSQHLQSTVDKSNNANIRELTSSGSAKAKFVRIKPTLPIMIKDLPIRTPNQLMRAISKVCIDERSAIQHDGLGEISKIETESRIYTVNGIEGPHGLVLYIDMKDGSWRKNFRDTVNLYKYEYAGKYDPVVITVINASKEDDQELKELSEIEIRDSLNDMGLRGDDYPVIFCDVDTINNTQHIPKFGDLHRSIVELLTAIDDYFITP